MFSIYMDIGKFGTIDRSEINYSIFENVGVEVMILVVETAIIRIRATMILGFWSGFLLLRYYLIYLVVVLGFFVGGY